MRRDEVVVVSATVVTDDPEHIARAAEVFGRACAGLVLEGMSVSLSLGRGDAEEVTEP